MKIEKMRGAFVTLIIELIRFFKNSIIVTNNLSSHNFFIFDILLYIFQYSIDILYVKNFQSSSLKLLLSTFGTYVLGRYIIVSTLQFIISKTSALYFTKIISYVHRGNKEQVIKRESYIELFITALVNVFILGPILYNLKFSWVFDKNAGDTYNLIVMMWFTLSITLYMILNIISKIKS